MLRLPEEMREDLSKPYGRLYRGNGIEVLIQIEDAKTCKHLACVGDLVSFYALKAGLKPGVIVVDGKTVREEVLGVERISSIAVDYTRIDTVNPPGHISCELVSSLKKAVELLLKMRKIMVVVDGEEDLAVMPLALLLPDGSLILYGQPGEGVVAFEVDRENKVLILSLMRKMEKVGECEEIEMLLGANKGGD
jgi:hypothetical protein